jgi:hypothetical protein
MFRMLVWSVVPLAIAGILAYVAFKMAGKTPRVRSSKAMPITPRTSR